MGYDDIGNNPKCYRIYIPSIGKYIKSGHVTFDEETFPAKRRQLDTRVEILHNEDEESIGYWVIRSGISLFIRIRLWALIDLTF